MQAIQCRQCGEVVFALADGPSTHPTTAQVERGDEVGFYSILKVEAQVSDRLYRFIELTEEM